jgi:hypothetical protein
MKRSGFRISARPATAAWLSPFIFSDTQAYVLEWSDHATLLHQRRPHRDGPGDAL